MIVHQNADATLALNRAAENCWKAILQKDTQLTGKYMTESFNAQIAMFPDMATPEILEQMKTLGANTAGCKVSGAGGGEYLIFFSENTVKNAIQIRIRRT